ncbi:hypothetical protein ACFSLT_28745 [Novosphingobium resinovorum]
MIRLDPPGPLLIQPGSACDLLIEAAMAGLGVVRLFEDWLAPAMQSGALERILDEWDEPFSGPMLYYSGRRQLPLRSGPSSTSPGRSQPCQSCRGNDIGLHQGAVRGY